MQALRSLINQLSPATVPHYTIPHTLGTLAAVNTHGVVPHIKEILSKMLPLLSLVKQDGLKQAFAYGKFCYRNKQSLRTVIVTANGFIYLFKK